MLMNQFAINQYNNHMRNLLNFIKKEKLPILGIVVAIAIFSLAILAKNNVARQRQLASPTASPTPTPFSTGIGGDIDKLADKLGKPINGEKPTDGIAEYKSGNLSLNNQVIYRGGHAEFYRQIILVSEKRTGKGIQGQIGKPEAVLNGPSSEFGYYLYAYPSKGTAYVANAGTDNVTEVWYFPPTDLPTFLSNWAHEYSPDLQEQGF